MKLLLGFPWTDAVEFAVARGWRVNHTRQDFSAPDGERILYCRGDPVDAIRISGHIFNEVIRGRLHVAPEVDVMAARNLRPVALAA